MWHRFAFRPRLDKPKLHFGNSERGIHVPLDIRFCLRIVKFMKCTTPVTQSSECRFANPLWWPEPNITFAEDFRRQRLES